MDQLTGRGDTAEQLLGVGRVADVARSLVAKASLPSGRFEAHEFGRDQHSSASAGGLLIGLAGTPQAPDDLLRPVVADVLGLVHRNGSVRGHDADPDAGNNTWAEAQVLLGLLTRPHLLPGRHDAVGAIGISRVFAFGGHRGRSIHDPDEKPVLRTTAESYTSSAGTSINHFHEKLLLLKDRMNTRHGRAPANARHEFMERFLDEFHAEWNGRA